MKLGRWFQNGKQKKRNKGWFKLSTDNEKVEEGVNEGQVEELVVENENINTENILSKENQDKTVLDLIVSTENIVKERKLFLYEINALNEQLASANETINRIKQELSAKDQMLEDNKKEIENLEKNLASNQSKYDQLLEDYKQYRNEATAEYEKISVQLKLEMDKYKQLNEEFKAFKQESSAKINELTETIRNLEIENKRYIKQYHEILEEKSKLIESINAFTERMSSSFLQKVAKSSNNGKQP